MLHIITVADSITETSMPINEFVIYRNNSIPSSKQYLIVCSKDKYVVKVPKEIKVFKVGKSITEFFNTIKIIKKYVYYIDSEAKIIYHLHQPKSALLFYLSTYILGNYKYTVFTVHSTYGDRNIKYKITSLISSLLAKYVSCVSKSGYDSYPLLIKYIKKSNFLMIRNGVDFNRVSKISSLYNNKLDKRKMFKLIYVARMVPLKNHKFLLNVIKRLPDSKLILVGEEDEKKEIRKYAIELGIDEQIEIKGLISREEVFRELCKCGIYVSSSLVEGMPISVLEAMSIGLIPVISNIAPHNEITLECDYVNTLKLSIDEWVSTIQQIQRMNIEEILLQSKNIKKCIRKKFSLDVMHKKYTDMYNNM